MSARPARRRGRPALTAGQPSVPLHLRLSAIDYDTASRIARKNGSSIPEVLRRAFRLATRRPATLEDRGK